MKTLSEFLAEFIGSKTILNPNRIKEMFHNGIEAYKEHLQTDCPKTVHWAMIEKQIIEALTKAEQLSSISEDKDICIHPEFKVHAGCDNCKIFPCKARLVAGPFTQDELAELSAKAANSGTDLTMDKIAYPICPLNMYFEGDENKCNTEACDFNTESRSCNQSCKIGMEN